MNELLLIEIENFGNKPEHSKLTNKGFDTEGYKTAIRRAAVDLTPRTLTRRDEAQGRLVDALIDEDGNSLLKQIEAYFDAEPMDEKSFDNWHKTMCSTVVLPLINKYYTQKNGSDVCYGKAQKIVNMTLKGCYCLIGAREKEEYFKHCHMALDSFTLAWYKRNGYKINNEWSKLSESEYLVIKDNIRKISPEIELFEGLTPLQKEFFIWPLEIMSDTVKTVNKCMGGFVKEPHASDYFCKHKMENDLLMSRIILGMDPPDRLDSGFIDWLRKTPKNQSGKVSSAEAVLLRYGINEDALSEAE